MPSLNNCCKRRGRLEFIARQQLRRWNDDPNSFLRQFAVVMWDWNKKGELLGCTRIVEEANAPTGYYNDEDGTEVNLRSSPLFVDDITNEFYNRLEPRIRYKMWIEHSHDTHGMDTSIIYLEITFLGNMLPNDLVHHIETIKLRAREITALNKMKQRVLVTTDMTAMTDVTVPVFMSYDFTTTSSFDNFFSAEATSVHKDIQHFLQNKSVYERLGRPWTYTVLNEGPPGVGKTKLVKAIAALTGYTLIIINLHHIPSMRTLYEAFHNPILDGDAIPHSKRLYYIPEVDTQICEVLKQRQRTRQRKPETVKAGIETTAVTKVARPTLGEILNVLDGVPERSGHILIMDTNHIDELDKALIRPGRVDRIVRWKALRGIDVRNYLENYYGVALPKKLTFPDHVYTAAELGALVSQQPLDVCLQTLKKN